ncbi:MAG TPA: MCP four helix bundle domain-containing protein [Nitrospira sp.]|nr:MCP four helix bundle domain-containing protein [Nitrospira sp.]
MPIHWTSVLISVLILASGVFGSQTLIRVDQDLRVIYAEYTLAATDLGHVNGELIRYRTSVIRAIEADTKEDFQRIVASLPQKHTRLNRAMERFVEATNASREGRMDARELTEFKAVRESIEAYLTSSHQALSMMEQRWNVASGAEAQRLQDSARQYVAKDTGAKFINVTIELDRLLEVVASIAGEVRKEADASLRVATMAMIAVSLALALLVLTIPLKAVSLRGQA